MAVLGILLLAGILYILVATGAIEAVLAGIISFILSLIAAVVDAIWNHMLMPVFSFIGRVLVSVFSVLWPVLAVAAVGAVLIAVVRSILTHRSGSVYTKGEVSYDSSVASSSSSYAAVSYSSRSCSCSHSSAGSYTLTVAGTSVPVSAVRSETVQQSSARTSSYAYVGNRRSHVLHRADGVVASSMLDRNKVWFSSLEEAESRGYRLPRSY